jgi:hypothetical protein
LSDTARNNLDTEVARGFGEEWSRFRQDENSLPQEERAQIFEDYFRIFPWHLLPTAGGVGIDVGCGAGRWWMNVASGSNTCTCSRPWRWRRKICVLQVTSASTPIALPTAAKLSRFRLLARRSSSRSGCAGGARSHRRQAQARCTAFGLSLLRIENRPSWYRWLWRVSKLGRLVISRLPYSLRFVVSNAVAGLVYWPLACGAKVLCRFGVPPQSLPLGWYSDKSFHVMCTDAYERLARVSSSVLRARRWRGC